MIARLLSDNTVVRIETDNEDRFLEVNPTGGFFKIDTLPFSEFSKWKMVDGVVVVNTELEIIIKEEEEKARRKSEIAQQLENLTITTSKGNVFDANNQARLDMQNAITASDFLSVAQTTWRMADDSEVLIELSELKEALALAIQEYARVKGIG